MPGARETGSRVDIYIYIYYGAPTSTWSWSMGSINHNIGGVSTRIRKYCHRPGLTISMESSGHCL